MNVFGWLKHRVRRVLGIPGAARLSGCRCPVFRGLQHPERMSEQRLVQFRVHLMGRLIPVSTVVEFPEQLRRYRRYAVHRPRLGVDPMRSAELTGLCIDIMQRELDRMERRHAERMALMRRLTAAGIRP